MSAPDSPKRVGRPPGVEYDSILTVRVEATIHDSLIREALRLDKPVSEIVRQRLLSSPSFSAEPE